MTYIQSENTIYTLPKQDFFFGGGGVGEDKFWKNYS